MSSSGGGEPRTVDVPLTAPSASVSYTLPPGVTFDVEAVYIEVDTSGAGGAVTAELTISEQSGVVIAKKTQGATIPAATTGTATWALRLTDESAGGSTPTNAVLYDTSPQAATFLESTTATGTTIEDKGNAGSSGVHIHSDNGAGGGGFIDLTTEDGEVFIGSTNVTVKVGAFDDLEVQNHLGAVKFRVNDNGDVEAILSAFRAFYVRAPNGTPLLKVTDGGGGAATYEIQTGAAWVADL